MQLEPVRTLEPVAVVNSVVALAEAFIGVAVGLVRRYRRQHEHASLV